MNLFEVVLIVIVALRINGVGHPHSVWIMALAVTAFITRMMGIGYRRLERERRERLLERTLQQTLTQDRARSTS